MKTQRVNMYVSGAGLPVYYIEQYNPQVREWFNIGGTYEKYEHAELDVNLHNIKELLKKEQ